MHNVRAQLVRRCSSMLEIRYMGMVVVWRQLGGYPSSAYWHRYQATPTSEQNSRHLPFPYFLTPPRSLVLTTQDTLNTLNTHLDQLLFHGIHGLRQAVVNVVVNCQAWKKSKREMPSATAMLAAGVQKLSSGRRLRLRVCGFSLALYPGPHPSQKPTEIALNTYTRAIGLTIIRTPTTSRCTKYSPPSSQKSSGTNPPGMGGGGFPPSVDMFLGSVLAQQAENTPLFSDAI